MKRDLSVNNGHSIRWGGISCTTPLPTQVLILFTHLNSWFHEINACLYPAVHWPLMKMQCFSHNGNESLWNLNAWIAFENGKELHLCCLLAESGTPTEEKISEYSLLLQIHWTLAIRQWKQLRVALSRSVRCMLQLHYQSFCFWNIWT